MKKLVIISHTEHQRDTRGGYVGFGPTVNEINFLSEYWDEVTHVACLEEKEPKGNSLPYLGENIAFMPIPFFGGKTWLKKLGVVIKIPGILYTVHQATRNATHIQLRLPMGIGFFLIVYFLLMRKKSQVLWVKYANNWVAKPASLSYAIQRWILKKNFLACKVTINGFWPDQPGHCLSFENPSLTALQRKEGIEWIENRDFHDGPYNIVFVGRVEYMKGVDLIINTIKQWPKEKIKCFHVIGEGQLLADLESELKEAGITYLSHGYLQTAEVYTVLRDSDYLLLPSRSEGFPKVISEALNYGCIPIVTEVGSIAHYIEDNKNGFILSSIKPSSFLEKFCVAIQQKGKDRQLMARAAREMVDKFTFPAYLNKLKENIFYVI